MVHLEKKVKKVSKTKQRKLGKLANDVTLKEHVSERFKEHLSLFTFYNEFVKFCEEFCPDVVNLANLVTLGPVCNVTNDISKSFEESHDDTFKDSPNENEPNTKEVTNAATLLDGRYQGKFVSPNVVNLSSRILNKAEVSLLSKGLQFIPTPKNIIKEADKGSGIVVWDRKDYLAEAKKQLDDKEVYQEVRGDIESLLIKIIKRVLGNIRNRRDISDETLDYFLVNNPKLGRFYLLPKIHKRLHNVPVRPVISNSGFYTENISAFVEHHLKPLAQKVKSYVKDTNDFLRKIANLPPLPEDLIFCTIDVVGLYPNIPHDEGLKAVRNALDSREDKTISTESLLELAECVLKNNIFEHNTKFFKQVRGTAIGIKMAPPYAIIYLDELERGFLENYHLQPLVWWRYIDDIFMLWQHGEKELKKFLDILNCYHPSIKFTWDYAREKINFLDGNVIRKDNQLITYLYIKPTDTHQYLHASSCHVYHCKKSIPYSQALRLNRICSENYLFDKRCNDLEMWLKERGYSDKLVRQQILNARNLKKAEILNKPKDKIKEKRLVLNVTYHPAFSKLKKVMSNIHILLTPDQEHNRVFKEVPIIGFRRAKSLKNLLVRAKVPPLYKKEGSCGPCNKPRCKMCPRITKSTIFKSFSNSGMYHIRPEYLN